MIILNKVFCNCGDVENTFYQEYLAAENNCVAQPLGGGYGSCLAVEMGYLSVDCRTQHPEAIMASIEGHEEYYDGCLVEPFPPSLNATEGWQWPGAYPYETTDDAFTNFLACLKVLMIGDCQQKAIEDFQCV